MGPVGMEMDEHFLGSGNGNGDNISGTGRNENVCQFSRKFSTSLSTSSRLLNSLDLLPFLHNNVDLTGYSDTVGY